MIKKKFIYCRELATFEANKSNISNEAIVFIEDVNCIYAHGRYFYCANEAFESKLGEYVTKEELSSTISELINGAPETFDTFKEIADYISEHGVEFADLVSDLNQLKEQVQEISESKQDKGNYLTYNLVNGSRKVITLNNADLINAHSNNEELENKVEVNGRAISLIQLNRWNVVDIGSPYTITNINVPDGGRVTVQEKSQSGPEANVIAYVSDVADAYSDLQEKIDEFGWEEL